GRLCAPAAARAGPEAGRDAAPGQAPGPQARPAARRQGPCACGPPSYATAREQASLAQRSAFKGHMAHRTGPDEIAVQVGIVVPELFILGAGDQGAAL